MYLKKIEIQGFKSFANKITLDFHNGITGIVGPNGSGKSNVSDAVRWVLGEQSAKQLRGGSMQDVIFAGTQLKKPQGFAFVAITLDNKDKKLSIDYEEVTVSRRIYRSGESEYMLNGSLCRLKDIQELFYDTGIGKDGYSIIGQGQVDQILSGKADDRRKLFDEAAGITKFKQRKTVALRKLESQEANLLRIGDIVSELEKQVLPLKKQSETARQYLKYRDELKVFDVNYYIHKSGDCAKELKEIDKNTKILDDNLKEETKKSDELKSNYENIENDLVSLDDKLNELRDESSNLNLSIKENSGKIELFSEKITTNKESKNHITNRLDNIKNLLATNKKDEETYIENKKELENKLEEVLENKVSIQKEIDSNKESIFEIEAKLSAYNQDKMSAIDERGKIFASQKTIETMLSQIQIRKSEISQKIIELKSKEEEIRAQKVDVLTSLEIKQEEINQINIDIAEFEKAQYELVSEYNSLLNVINDIKNKYQNTFAKLESLKNISERYEGYGYSIKKVMDTRDRIQGVHGVLADLISVKKDYEVAIETALGGRVQNIITDTEHTAKNLIEYLKKNKYGRATFLPIASIKSRYRNETSKFANEVGFLGFANELIDAKDIYKDILAFLLARVLVVDNIDNAIKIAKKYNYEYKIVTLEGDVLNTGGSLSGGAYKNTSNLLGRKRELKDLEDLSNKYAKEEEIKSKELKDLDIKLNEYKNKIEEKKVNLSDENIKANIISKNISVLDEKIEENSLVLEEKIQEMSDFDEQLNDYKEQLRQSEIQIAFLDDTNKNKDDETQKINEELIVLKDNSEKLGDKLSNININEATYLQNLEFIKNNLLKISEDKIKFDEEIKELNIEIQICDDNIKEKEEDIKNSKILIKNNEEKLEELEKILSSYKVSKEEKTQIKKQYFVDMQECQNVLSVLDKDLFRLGQKKEKLEDELASLTNYIWNEYELTYNMAITLENKELNNVAKIKESIKELKSKIRALGSVNVNAIKDYEEVSERYETMSTQYDDIVKSKDELITIITELDLGMRKQFSEKFAEIDNEFNKVFKELFGGGNARLELNEEEDILDAQISIISQPPGKKLQNMMQLSGGEKALTAISLLFAIQNLRPSPFALLDEIEAALDDSNVDRFARYLHKLTTNTQFIVITHRRGTMVSADRLYGITMQEKGVSTLVSVNLIEDDLKS